MKSLTFICLLIIFSLTQSVLLNRKKDAFKDEKNEYFTQDTVVQVYQTQLQQVIEDFRFVICLFLDEFSEERLSEYRRVSESVNSNNRTILFTYVVDTIQSPIFQEYQINQNDQLLFFTNGRSHRLGHGLSEGLIETAIKELTDRKIQIINERSQFDEFYQTKNKTKILVVIDFNEQKKTKMIIDSMMENDVFADSGNFLVAYSNDQSIIPFPDDTELPSLILYRENNEPGLTSSLKYKGNLNSAQEMMEFINIHSLPLISVFEEDTIFRTFAGPIKTQFVMVINRNDDNSELLKMAREVALHNYQKELSYLRILFTIIYNEPQNKEMLDFFDIQDSHKLPRLFISNVDKENSKMVKFAYNQESLSVLNMSKFIEDFRKNNIKSYRRSENSPENNHKNILKIATNENFQREIVNNKNNSIVLFYSFHDVAIKQCSPVYKILKFMASRQDPNSVDQVQFYVFDVIKNDFEDLGLKGIPELRIYLRGEKKRPKVFRTDRKQFTLKAMAEFFNVYFPRSEIKYTKKEEDDMFLEILSPEDRDGVLKARQNTIEMQKEAGEEPDDPLSDYAKSMGARPAVIPKINRADYEAGINPLYKEPKMERVEIANSQILREEL